MHCYRMQDLVIIFWKYAYRTYKVLQRPLSDSKRIGGRACQVNEPCACPNFGHSHLTRLLGCKGGQANNFRMRACVARPGSSTRARLAHSAHKPLTEQPALVPPCLMLLRVAEKHALASFCFGSSSWHTFCMTPIFHSSEFPTTSLLFQISGPGKKCTVNCTGTAASG